MGDKRSQPKLCRWNRIEIRTFDHELFYSYYSPFANSLLAKGHHGEAFFETSPWKLWSQIKEIRAANYRFSVVENSLAGKKETVRLNLYKLYNIYNIIQRLKKKYFLMLKSFWEAFIKFQWPIILALYTFKWMLYNWSRHIYIT